MQQSVDYACCMCAALRFRGGLQKHHLSVLNRQLVDTSALYAGVPAKTIDTLPRELSYSIDQRVPSHEVLRTQEGFAWCPSQLPPTRLCSYVSAGCICPASVSTRNWDVTRE